MRVAIVATALLAGCGAGNKDNRPLVSVSGGEVIAGRPSTVFTDALWIGPRRVLTTQLDGEKLRPRLVELDTRTAAVTTVAVAVRPGCSEPGSSLPTRLGKREIAYLSTCFGGDGTPDKINQIRRVDFVGHGDRPLFSYYVWPFTGRFTFSPDGRRGLLNDGYGLAEHLRWLDARLSRPIRLPGIVRAGMPSWDPDGNRVVFDAVAVGFRGDVAVAPRGLYVADASDLSHPKLLLTGITDVAGTGASWVPDHPWVLFPMHPASRPLGLWLVDVSNGRKVLIKSGAGFGRADVNASGVVALPEHADAPIGTTRRARMELFRLDYGAIRVALS